jgi:hypothetical protein
MTDRSDDQDPLDDIQPTIVGSRAPGMPRWVKVFLITAVALIAIMVIAMVASGGRHGPGRHTSSEALSTAALHPIVLVAEPAVPSR